MRLTDILNQIYTNISLHTETWISILIGALVTLIIGYIIYKIQKKETTIHKLDHDAKLEEIKLLHQQDSEKIKVLYELIIQSQRGSIGEIEAAVLEQKIEVAAELITDQDSDHAQALKAIADKDKDEADSLLDKIAEQEHNLLGMYKLRALNECRNGFYSEAVKWYRKIVEMMPEDFTQLDSLLQALNNAGQTNEARAMAQNKLNTLDKQDNPEAVSMIILLDNISEAYCIEQNYDAAEPYTLRSYEIRKNHFGETHLEMGNAYNNIAVLYGGKGKYKESEECFLKSVAVQEADDKNGIGLIQPYSNLANLYLQQNRDQEALPLLEKAIQIISDKLGADHPYIIHPYNTLGNIYANLGRCDKALELLLKARAISDAKLGLHHPFHIEISLNLAYFYKTLGKLTQEEEVLRCLLDNKDTPTDNGSNKLDTVLFKLALNLHAQGKPDEAELYYTRALPLLRKAHPVQPDNLASTLNNLGVIYRKTGRYHEAETYFLEVDEINEKIYPQVNLQKTITKMNLGNTYIRMERWSEAEQYMQHAVMMFGEMKSVHPYHIDALHDYASILEKLGRHAEADEYKAKAEELKTKLEGHTTENTEETESSKG